MNKLSQEVVDIIARHLHDLLEKDAKSSKLAPFSTISYRWTHAVENILFASISIKDAELSRAEEILGSNGGRWRYVRCLTYKFGAAAPRGKLSRHHSSRSNVNDQHDNYGLPYI